MQDWNKLKVEDLDKTWEGGDDPEELKSSFEALREIEAQKQKDVPQFDENNPAAFVK